jgi:hypothetical protein
MKSTSDPAMWKLFRFGELTAGEPIRHVGKSAIPSGVFAPMAFLHRF